MILRVMIVEDEDMIRNGLVKTLPWADMGCTVIGSAGDGKSGLEQIIERRPDVVITDIRMPEMDGFEMLERALAVYRFHIIIFTSYAEFDYAQKAISIHAYDYLLKPLDTDELKLILGKAAQQRLAELLARIRETEEPQEQLETPGSFSAEELLKRLAYTDEYVETALRRIVAASDTKLSIEELADEMMISASYLSRRFKQSTGQTFLDTLNTQRVKRAAALLKNGGRTSEVAEKTGFSDYKHFCAVFKRYTGMTPRDFGKRK